MPVVDAGPPTLVHISLNVRALPAAIAFYEAFLGVPPHKVRPGYANFALTVPPLKLALNEHPVADRAGEPGALSHLGFQVPDADTVAAAKERLQAAGLATFDETDTTCCYARQDKIWVHDPDGNAWEIYVLLDDREDDDDHAGRALREDGLIAGTALSVPRAADRKSAPRCCQ